MGRTIAQIVDSPKTDEAGKTAIIDPMAVDVGGVDVAAGSGAGAAELDKAGGSTKGLPPAVKTAAVKGGSVAKTAQTTKERVAAKQAEAAAAASVPSAEKKALLDQADAADKKVADLQAKIGQVAHEITGAATAHAAVCTNYEQRINGLRKKMDDMGRTQKTHLREAHAARMMAARA